jgi:putative phosphoserine phosphatase / 1-acylglycerol-3-phosphate O-acyltransferase
MNHSRIPGSIAEIDLSPEGPQVAAFFDLDGTVILGFSAQVLTEERLRRREVGAGELFRLGRLGLAAGLGRAGFSDLLAESALALAGRRDDELAEMGERLYAQKIADRVYPEARDLVAAHQRRGHTVVLLSSATVYQAAPVAAALGIDHVQCNRLRTKDGVLTGEVEEPIVWGESKAERAQAFATAHGVDLGQSYFYADGDEDAALMHLVGHPRPTNPRSGLEAVAKRRGWPILRFSSRARLGTVERMRNVVGISSIVPAATTGLAVGLLARRRRTGVDFFITRWLDTLFLSCGVSFDVQGEENLWAERPAVFIFNHRNNLDVLMAAKLVRREFTSVGKKEAADNPLGAVLGNLIDAVFIDRSDAVSAVEALQPVHDAVARGLSLIISPEGTRSVSREVGRFKKGPFRIAMAAGVPIVPIVFRNADEIAPRETLLMRPGTVDAVVLPPISTSDWTLDELDERIASVRDAYVATLADWPGRSI